MIIVLELVGVCLWADDFEETMWKREENEGVIRDQFAEKCGEKVLKSEFFISTLEVL